MKHLMKEPGLVKLFQQAELYQMLLDSAQTQLPDNLASHLMGVSIEKQTLICLVDHANWASKLRFFQQPLLTFFQQQLPHMQLSQVQFKLMPDMQEKPKIKRTANRPDEQAAQAMRQLSENLPPKVADALKRLSQRAQEK